MIVKVLELESIEDVATVANFVCKYDEIGAEVLAYNNIEDAVKLMEECYQGEHGNEVGFAYSLFNDCYEIPEFLTHYIKYEKIARDLSISDYINYRVAGETHVFIRP